MRGDGQVFKTVPSLPQWTDAFSGSELYTEVELELIEKLKDGLHNKHSCYKGVKELLN